PWVRGERLIRLRYVLPTSANLTTASLRSISAKSYGSTVLKKGLKWLFQPNCPIRIRFFTPMEATSKSLPTGRCHIYRQLSEVQLRRWLYGTSWGCVFRSNLYFQASIH